MRHLAVVPNVGLRLGSLDGPGDPSEETCAIERLFVVEFERERSDLLGVRFVSCDLAHRFVRRGARDELFTKSFGVVVAGQDESAAEIVDEGFA
jgi:hypothetical protein